MIDFLTIVFNHNIEIELLKLQAISFKYCDPDMIGKIFIFYNDSGVNKIEYLKKYYPKKLLPKVNIIYKDNYFSNNNINIKKYKYKGWRFHAFLKLWLANKTESDVYCFLDAKNHFIRKITLDNFFENGKYKIFFTKKQNVDQKFWGENYYNNGFKYFNIKIPDELSLKYVNIGTPFLYDKNIVIDMIKYIETKNKKPFIDFYMEGELLHVECSIYLSYLYFIKNTAFVFKQRLQFFTIFHNPYVKRVLNFINSQKIYDNDTLLVFGLHRVAIDKIDDSFKNKLLIFYSKFYDEKTCAMIKSFMYH